MLDLLNKPSLLKREIMDFINNNYEAILITLSVGAGFLLWFLTKSLYNYLNRDGAAVEDKTAKSAKTHHQQHDQAQKKKQPQQDHHKQQKNWATRIDKQGFTHPWLLTSLKGHTGQVLDLDFSSNGKFLVTCAEDRAVFLWDCRDLTQNHKSLRINIEFDHPVFVKWSPDTKAFIVQKFIENTVEVYKVEKKKDGWLGHATKALTFPKEHDSDVIGFGIASTGKYIMTCSNKTDLIIWDLKGQVLSRVDTYLMTTTCAIISPCGRFVAASGFAPDAKVWEVIFNKSGEFQEVKRVFELTGHSSGIYHLAFDADSSNIATVSKDGTWRLYDIKIEYKKGEDPHLKLSGKYEPGGNFSKIGLSPNAEVVVIATHNTLQFFSTLTGKLDAIIENVHAGPITALIFDALGKYLLTTGDKQIRVFHNVTGYKCQIETAKEKLKEHLTSATKERLEKLIEENNAFLSKIRS